MTQAIRLTNTGGPDVMKWETFDPGRPGSGELRIKHTAVGLNFIDIYHREGAYPLPLPTGLGVEGVGIVVDVGVGVTDFKPGDRIAYAGGPPGAYAFERLIPAGRAVLLPEYIEDEVAASVFFKGLTVEYLIRRCYPVEKGDTVLWHAAAGGVGTLAGQWLSDIGATVIGTVGSDAKASHARQNGYTHTVNYKSEDFVARVRELTDGVGVAVAYDSVGKDTIMGSLDCVRTRGTLVSFGTTSGPTPLIDLATLGGKGSLYLTRASVAHYTAKRPELENAANAVFSMLKAGKLRAAEPTRFALKDVADAHRELQSGKTSGSVILVP
ncbi:quinone oxidoreductase family protein [Paraburkholderia sp. XV]|uniref:quinone oxidoreductase family protein n=1 Tax=Paraburkholderia sp. XV TaxID=2831520 RepID=UPI001CD4F15A|nr:quinone oxidoreductase [Paraburkholderia sp. XV]